MGGHGVFAGTRRLGAVSILALAACDAGLGMTAMGAPAGGGVVASVAVTPTSVTLTAIGAAQQFTAVARDSSNTPIVGVKFTWTSTNTTVVTVDSTGLARAAGSGVAAVTARANGIEGLANVTVSAP